MGHQAILCGRIQEFWESSQSRGPTTPEYNNSVLESLPNALDADEDELLILT